MPDKLYGGLHENDFRKIAKAAVVKAWNEDAGLVGRFGIIAEDDVYVVWQVKAIQNNKALLGVSRDGDGRYYEYTWNGDALVGYLDVYFKTRHLVLDQHGNAVED